MLNKSEVCSFFVANSIELECEKLLSVEEVNNLITNAAAQGRSFTGFISLAVINADRTGINPCFRSEEDLWDAYCAYMTGYMTKERGEHGGRN